MPFRIEKRSNRKWAIIKRFPDGHEETVAEATSKRNAHIYISKAEAADRKKRK